MGNLVDHARKELEIAGLFDKDSDYGGMMAETVLKMIEQFADDEHSGFSANMAVNLFDKLARFEPLTPLTGEDSEWNDVSSYEPTDPTGWQNNRCSHVFKRKDGTAYDLDGKIFRGPDGHCWTNGDSRVEITFPYVPTREYVDVSE